jgi:hypothetical protein
MFKTARHRIRPAQATRKNAVFIPQKMLDSDSLICPSCQIVAVIVVDREGKSPAYLALSRARKRGVGHRH